jgi:hypothetical protein
MGNAAPVRGATDFEVATLGRVRSLLEDNSSRTAKHLLKRLWAATMPPGEVAYAAPSPHWVVLGFSSPDPRADLRGGGCLALEQLVFFAEQFQSTFVHVVMTEAQRRDPARSLPLARLGVQISYEVRCGDHPKEGRHWGLLFLE